MNGFSHLPIFLTDSPRIACSLGGQRNFLSVCALSISHDLSAVIVSSLSSPLLQSARLIAAPCIYFTPSLFKCHHFSRFARNSWMDAAILRFKYSIFRFSWCGFHTFPMFRRRKTSNSGENVCVNFASWRISCRPINPGDIILARDSIHSLSALSTFWTRRTTNSHKLNYVSLISFLPATTSSFNRRMVDSVKKISIHFLRRFLSTFCPCSAPGNVSAL